MANLLEVHTQLLKEAEEKRAAEQLITERVTVLEKYATTATELMNQVYPNNHTQEDVIELADRMIQHDLQVEEQQQKIAELDEAGRIMARAFMDEVNKPK
jgi:hypothetical protein